MVSSILLYIAPPLPPIKNWFLEIFSFVNFQGIVAIATDKQGCSDGQVFICIGCPKNNHPSGISRELSCPKCSKLSKVVQTCPDISFGFGLESFRKGIFLGHPVYVMILRPWICMCHVVEMSPWIKLKLLDNCHKFVNCWRGRGTLQTCNPPSLVFNQATVCLLQWRRLALK